MGRMFGAGFANKVGMIGDILTGDPVFARRMDQQREDALRQQQADAEAAYRTQMLDLQRQKLAQGPDPTSLQRDYEYLKGINPQLAEQYLQTKSSPLVPIQGFDQNGTPGVTLYSRGGQPQPQMPAIGSVVADPRKRGGASGNPMPSFR